MEPHGADQRFFVIIDVLDVYLFGLKGMYAFVYPKAHFLTHGRAVDSLHIDDAGDFYAVQGTQSDMPMLRYGDTRHKDFLELRCIVFQSRLQPSELELAKAGVPPPHTNLHALSPCSLMPIRWYLVLQNQPLEMKV